MNIKPPVYLLYNIDENVVFPNSIDAFVLILNHVCTSVCSTLQLPFSLSLSDALLHYKISTLYVLY